MDLPAKNSGRDRGLSYAFVVTRKLLIVVLAIAFAIECAFAACGFAAPSFTLTTFHVGITPDTLFLGHVVAWCLLAVAIAAGLALRWVLARKRAGYTLSIALGLWWVGIGVALAVKFGRYENLALDALKGALLALFAWLEQRAASPSRDDVA